MRAFLILSLPFALSACGQPHHLSADYGESYRAMMATQSDLTRAAAMDDQYYLSGFEAMEIRMRSQEATTDEADAVPDSTATIAVE